MNETAKKLREVADRMGDGVVNSAPAIIMARKMFDVRSTTTFGGDLGNVLTVIADELDELQARATEANNLRKKLESAEDKAERRKQHIGYLETALHDKNALLEQRGGTIARLTAECSELRKQVPSERERQILDMWPRFEDGEYVWFGDSVEHDGTMETVQGFKLYRCGPAYLSVVGIDTEKWLRIEDYKSVKRPVQSVLDADGVEIKLGDTVWHCIGIYDELVVEEIEDESGWVRTRSANGACLSAYHTHLTHTRPDSWELLEEDAAELDDMPCDFNAKDLIRRAKALAGVEVD